MVLWNALYMSKAKILIPSTDAIDMIMQMEWITATGAYDTVKSNTSSMDDTYAHVLYYISYLFSMSVVLTLKYILGLSIFVSDGRKERKNDALNVVDVAIFS